MNAKSTLQSYHQRPGCCSRPMSALPGGEPGGLGGVSQHQQYLCQAPLLRSCPRAGSTGETPLPLATVFMHVDPRRVI